MNTFQDQPVPYHATAQRIGWDDLPTMVRDDITAHLGGPPGTIHLAGGGFTGGFAAVVTAADGTALFVKAAGPQMPFVVRSHQREAHVNPALPTGVPVPRLRFASQIGDWVVLGMTAVPGRAPRLPMSPTEVDIMLRAWADSVAALREPGAALLDLGLPELIDDLGDTVRRFTAMAAGEAELRLLPAGYRDHVGELAELESDLRAAISGPGVTHGDLRPDNMILAGDTAWICDWNWPAHGAAFFDTICFLVVAFIDGHDGDALLRRHPTSAGVADEQIDSALAAIAGYYLHQAQQPPFTHVSPHLRTHQRHNGLAALGWLARRRDW